MTLPKYLIYYGVKGLSNNLIQSYLANRKQFVEINDTKSDMLPITTGIPQSFIYWTLSNTLDSSKMQLVNFNNIIVELRKISEWT